jgi:1-acyl-sn-glycerol-3-phosphate acyltransferase
VTRPGAPSFRSALRVAASVLQTSGAIVLDDALGRGSLDRTHDRLRAWARQAMATTGIDLRVEGALPPGGTFVLMSNHQSHLDIACLYAALGPGMRMVAKKELFAFPFFGRAMRASGFIELDRQDRGRAIASLSGARAILDRGLHLWIAPEGTRSVSGELLPFKKGGFMMALEAHAAIVPIGLHGTHDALPPHALRVRTRCPVGVVIGDPIPTDGQSRDALMATTREALVALVARARALAAR